MGSSHNHSFQHVYVMRKLSVLGSIDVGAFVTYGMPVWSSRVTCPSSISPNAEAVFCSANQRDGSFGLFLVCFWFVVCKRTVPLVCG